IRATFQNGALGHSLALSLGAVRKVTSERWPFWQANESGQSAESPQAEVCSNHDRGRFELEPARSSRASEPSIDHWRPSPAPDARYCSFWWHRKLSISRENNFGRDKKKRSGKAQRPTRTSIFLHSRRSARTR